MLHNVFYDAPNQRRKKAELIAQTLNMPQISRSLLILMNFSKYNIAREVDILSKYTYSTNNQNY